MKNLDRYYEIKVELKRIVPQTNDVFTTFGSIPIIGSANLQEHIEMAGRAAAVQAYFHMLRNPLPYDKKD